MAGQKENDIGISQHDLKPSTLKHVKSLKEGAFDLVVVPKMHRGLPSVSYWGMAGNEGVNYVGIILAYSLLSTNKMKKRKNESFCGVGVPALRS